MLVIAFGVFLRFHALPRQSLWNDEAYTVQNISSSWEAAFYQPVNNHPPLYFAQLRLWQRLSPFVAHSVNGLAFLRANAALWGSVSLVLFYRLARRLLPPWPAAFGVALMAFSPLHLAYSQDARPYTLALAEAVAGFLLVHRIVSERGRVRTAVWVGMGVLWGCEMYTHYWGLFVAAAQFVYGCLATPRSDDRKRFSGSLVGAGVMFIFWWPVLRFHLRETAAHNFELFSPGWLDAGRTFTAFLGNYFYFGNQIFSLPWPRTAVATATVVAGIFFFVGLRKGPRLALVWIAVGVIVPFGISFARPIYLWYRYPFLSYGAFVLLVAAGLARVPWRWGRLGAALLLLSMEAAACRFYFQDWQKGNAKSAIEAVHAWQRPDSVIIRPRYFADVMSYYDATPSTNLIDEDTLDSPQKRDHLTREDVVFLSFDTSSDPVGDALKKDLGLQPVRWFPALPLHGITVYASATARRARHVLDEKSVPALVSWPSAGPLRRTFLQ